MKTITYICVLLLVLGTWAQVYAQVIHVSTGSDHVSGSLRDAIAKAQGGDTITFDTSLTEIALEDQISIDKSVTILGNERLTIYSNLNMPRIFLFPQTAEPITVSISNFKLLAVSLDIVTTKMDGAIILCDNSNATLNINLCFFTRKSGGGFVDYQQKHGGAIALYNGNVVVSNSTISNLAASSVSGSAGGAIFQIAGSLSLTNCTFNYNRAAIGSAIYTRNGTMDISNCTFADNDNYDALSTTARNYTLYNYSSQVSIKNSVFENNDYELVGTITSGGYNVFPAYSSALIYCTMLGDQNSNLRSNYNFSYTTNGYIEFQENGFWIKTCALDSTSVCVDALPADGNGAPTLDQRGYGRLNNADIGAFEYNGSTAMLGVSATTLSVSANENSTQTFDINSNIAWSAQSDQGWLSLSTTSGSGNASITISAAANPNTNTRVANITISADNVPTVYIVVTQDAAVAALGVSSTTLSVSADENSTQMFDIKSNIAWSAQSDQEWLSLSTTSGSGNASITISAATNPNTNTRVANITISADNVPTVYIVVTQDAAVAALGVSSTTLWIAAEDNSTQMFDISSNIAWSAKSDQEWLSLSTTSGSGNASITISAAANPNTNTRVANITIIGDNVPTLTIVVTQYGAAPTLGVLNTNLSIAAENNSTLSFDITSNTSWTFQIQDTWLSVLPGSGFGNATITMTASGNPNVFPRAAQITITSDNAAPIKMQITQVGAAHAMSVVSTAITIASAQNSTQNFDLTTNIGWTASSDQTWLSLSPDNGLGSTNISITAAANPTTIPRYANIALKGDNVPEIIIVVTQEGKPTGLEDTENNEISVYPIPASSTLYIQGMEQNCTIALYDIHGTLKTIENKHHQSIDVTDLPRGIYILHVTEKQRTTIRKIILE